jgi:hypothetical protein
MGVFRDEPLMITGRFITPIATDNQIIQLLDTASVIAPYKPLETNYHVGYYFSLENLKVTYNLSNTLELAAIPDIAIEDSNSERAVILRENLRNYNYLAVKFYSDTGSGWQFESTLPIQNFDMESQSVCLQPYLTMADIELLGQTDKIGVLLTYKNAGTERAANDYVVFKGNWVLKVTLKERISDAAISSTNPISVEVGPSRQLILPSRGNRKTLFLQNRGDSTVYVLPTNTSSQLNVGAAPFMEPNGVFSWEGHSPLTTAIWAISESGTNQIVGFEGLAAI